MADTNLNAAQLQHIQNEASKALQLAVDKMQLRKWAVEQAFSVVSLLNALIKKPTDSGHPTPRLTINDPMALAAAVYDFVSQAGVVRVDVTGGSK